MRKVIFAALAVGVLAALSGCNSARHNPAGVYEVAGVEADDMLKLRAGPGTGFSIIAGLPNGTVLRVKSCERTGGTRWCKVSMMPARGADGYVSWAYLRPV